MKLDTPRLILASASPRRRELLAGLGLSFDIVPSVADEAALLSEAGPCAPADLVSLLAREKAMEVAQRTQRRALVIGADTLVVLDGQIMGKPVDEEDAVGMLLRLSGRTHKVYTGIAIVPVQEGISGEAKTDFAVTDVTFLPLSEQTARAYVATGEPMDKAGAYGIQQKGALLIERIDGDYFNVVGLPLTKLAGLLGKSGVNIW